MKVLDELGFVREYGYVCIYVPAYERFLVFQVISRLNRGHERFIYGPLPLKSGTTIGTLEGGSTTVPADGVFPARGAIPIELAITFPVGAYESLFPNIKDKNDIFYHEYSDQIYHVKVHLTPPFIKVQVTPWKGIGQYWYQEQNYLTLAHPTGWSYGSVELWYFPKVHWYLALANEMYFDVYTRVIFHYAIYRVRIPKDPELIYDIIVTQKVPAYHFTLQYFRRVREVDRKLSEVYGFKIDEIGFPWIRDRDEAIKEYRRILDMVKSELLG